MLNLWAILSAIPVVWLVGDGIEMRIVLLGGILVNVLAVAYNNGTRTMVEGAYSLLVFAPLVLALAWFPDSANINASAVALEAIFGYCYSCAVVSWGGKTPLAIRKSWVYIVAGITVLLVAILLSVDLKEFVNRDKAILTRTNRADFQLQYLYFFKISNFILALPLMASLHVATLAMLSVSSRIPSKIFIYSCGVLAGYLTAATFARTLFVAGVLGILYAYILLRVRARQGLGASDLFLALTAVAGVAVGALAIPPEYLERLKSITSDGRFDLWSEAVRRILDSPLRGSRGQFVGHTWAHNYILDFGLSGGVFGVIGSILVFVWITWTFVLATAAFVQRRIPRILLVWMLLLVLEFCSAMTGPPAHGGFVRIVVGAFVLSAIVRQTSLANYEKNNSIYARSR